MPTNMTKCHFCRHDFFMSNFHYYNALAQQVTIIEFL